MVLYEVTVMKKRQNSTLQYTFLQAMLWATYGFLFSYANPFLTEKLGLSDTLSGIILCAATGASCLLQPVLTAATDRTRLNVRWVLLLSSAFTAICAGASMAELPIAATTVLFAGACVGLQVLPSFTNALGMARMRSGEQINFGLSRGVGSICFGVSARLAPIAIAHMGLNGVPAAGGTTALLFLVAVLVMKEKHSLRGAQSADTESEPSPAAEFFRKHKKFVGMLLAAVLLYVGHNVLSNCMLRIAQSKLTNAALEEATGVQGTALLIAALVELPTMFLFTNIVKKIRCDILLFASCVFMTLRLLLSLVLPGAVGLYIAQTAQMLGYAVFAVSTVYYAGSVIEKRNVVKGQTYLGTANTLGCMLAYALGGTLIDAVGVSNMLLVCIAVSVVGCALALLCLERVEKTVGA